MFSQHQITIPDSIKTETEKYLSKGCTVIYLATDHTFAGYIVLSDTVRPEAGPMIQQLHKLDVQPVLLTGDNDNAAEAIAGQLGIREVHAGCRPEEKLQWIHSYQKNQESVCMIGDGINDSPALSAADVGIAISDGAEIAREIADITIGADDLYQIVTLKLLSDNLMKRIHTNYRVIVGFNAGLILCGVTGLLQPTASALLHNTSTLLIGLKSMQNLLD